MIVNSSGTTWHVGVSNSLRVMYGLQELLHETLLPLYISNSEPPWLDRFLWVRIVKEGLLAGDFEVSGL